MKGNLYWMQPLDYSLKIDPKNAISPIFNTKAQYTAWKKEARKTGQLPENFQNCQDHMNMHDL